MDGVGWFVDGCGLVDCRMYSADMAISRVQSRSNSTLVRAGCDDFVAPLSLGRSDHTQGM